MPDAARLRRLAASLHARARPALPVDLIPVMIAGAHVGDAQPAIARFLAQRMPEFGLDRVLSIDRSITDSAAVNAVLTKAARRLQAAGLIRGWRDELLSVGNPPVAVIERAACRALGITTHAVHLNAYRSSDEMFVARRSSHKQIDAGRWDNLVGGMVPAGESLVQALSREALEEAGLALDATALLTGRRFQVRRIVAEGLQSEIVHVFDTTLRGDQQLVNQDGEVDAIELRAIEELLVAIERDEFTLESGLVIVESLTRRNAIETPPGLFN